jgi:large-conductance mechanosensitive channel
VNTPDSSLVTPGLLGFLIVAALGFALYLLIKSMNKQISKIEVPREADLAREEKEKAAKQGVAGGRDKPGEKE